MIKVKVHDTHMNVSPLEDHKFKQLLFNNENIDYNIYNQTIDNKSGQLKRLLTKTWVINEIDKILSN